jgi:phosphatidylglycerophosphate synthase
MKREPLVTVPNLISLSRLGLAAAFVALKGTTPRLVIIAVAGASDFLDGFLARRGGSTSRRGALLDAVGDRFFVFTAVCTLLFTGALGMWQYAIRFLTARVIPWLRDVRFKSRRSGKVVTVLQLATLALVFAAPRFVNVALVAVGIVSLASISDYTLALWHARARA